MTPDLYLVIAGLTLVLSLLILAFFICAVASTLDDLARETHWGVKIFQVGIFLGCGSVIVGLCWASFRFLFLS